MLSLANALYISSAYVITMVVARELAPSSFAVYGIITGWASLLTALLVRGLTACISREMAESSQRSIDHASAWRAGAQLGVKVSMVFFLGGLIVAPVVAHLTGVSDHLLLVAASSVAALTFGLNAVLLSWPMGNQSYAQQAWAQAAYALSRLVLVIGGALYWGVPGAVIGYVFGPVLASSVLVRRWPKAKNPIGPIVRRMRQDFLPVGVVSITVTAYFIVDVFAMSAAGAHRQAIGVYVAFAALAHVPFYLLQAASATMVPAIAAASRQDQAVAIRRTLTDTLVLLAGPTLLLIAAGDSAARMIFGAKYQLHQGALVAPLAIGTVGITIIAGLVAVAVALKRIRRTLVITLLGVVLLAATCAMAASNAPSSPTGVAVAMCISALMTAGVLVFEASRHYGRLLEIRRLAVGLTLAMSVAWLPMLSEEQTIRVGIAVFSGIIWLTLVVRLRVVDLRANSTASS